MTGFGQAQVATPLARLSVQLKSVNSRFLDLTLKLPDELAAFEGKLRETVSQKVKRGKVELRISWQVLSAQVNADDSDENQGSTDDANVATLINRAALARVLAVQNAILAQTHNEPHRPAPLSVAQLMGAPAVLPSNVGAAEALAGVTAAHIDALIAEALTAFLDSRAVEGAHLADTVRERLNAIADTVHSLRARLPELLAHQEQKLTERLLRALDADKNEAAIATAAIPREELLERIKQETTLTAIRTDVAEELDRLDGHIANAQLCLNSGSQVGKKLDFLMQEFNREANTLGSKSASLAQTEASLNLKLLIEQMREQVQNLE